MKSLKHGDRVTCTIRGVDITDAKVSIDKNGYVFICHNIEWCTGIDTDNKLGYKYSFRVWSGSEEKIEENMWLGITNLEHVEEEKTWDTLAQGDTIVDDESKEREVLGICGRVILISTGYDKNVASCNTKEELIKRGYTIKSAQPQPETMTTSQAEEALEKALGRKVVIK